jgi:hypothetical protein
MRHGVATGFVAWAMPWIGPLAASAVIAYVANVAMIDALTASQAGIAVSVTSASADSDRADAAPSCDTSTGRMLYVAPLHECFPAEW